MKNITSKLHHFFVSDNMNKVIASILSIIAGIIISFILMLIIFGPAIAVEGVQIILTSGFVKGWTSFGNVLVNATPIILTGLSVGFAFKTGLFNIGASGQMTVGGLAAVFIGVRWTFLPGHLHWIVAVLGAIIIGGLWGLIPGILKALFNVHEVVATIMFNYIAMYLTVIGVVLTVYEPLRTESLSINGNAYLPQGFLSKIFPDSSVDFGILISLLAVIVIYIVLQKTTFGYQLKAVGYNRHAAKYAGINEKLSIILSMTIAGALAGLGGATLFLSNSDLRMQTSYTLLTQGFDGIAVALLGLSNPIGILFSGVFFGYIKESSLFLQTLPFKAEMIQIIISSIIYLSALALIFRTIVKKFLHEKAVASDTGGDE